MCPRSAFFNELKEIQSSILRMGSLVEQAVYDSVEATMKHDITVANQVIAGDNAIDQIYADVEERCIKLLATQQPLAKDLRGVFADIKILVNLERMGDYAVDIARLAIELSGEQIDQEKYLYIPKMAKLVQEMINTGLDSYAKSDIEKAKKISEMDDQVDKLFLDLYHELIKTMSNDSSAAVRALFVGRYLERIADHATNIAEEVVFIVTGKWEELN